MTIDEKREVIEVLLCAASITSPDKRTAWGDLSTPCRVIDGVFTPAVKARHAVRDEGSRRARFYGWTAMEAAYRLIESSPTLRREWFGRGAQ